MKHTDQIIRMSYTDWLIRITHTDYSIHLRYMIFKRTPVTIKIIKHLP